MALFSELPEPWIEAYPIAGDVSARSYARVRDSRGNTGILARYPRDVRHQIARDLESRAWCARHGIRVPELREYRAGSDWFVVEDLGTRDAEQVLEAAPREDRSALILKAVDPLTKLSRIPPAELPPWNPPLDRARMRWELAGFELWFLRHRCCSPPAEVIGRWLDDLAAEIDHHPKKICHRDFHLNNLFILGDGTVAVIDFQDILIGPDTYDVVSLLHERSMPALLDGDDRATVAAAWAVESGAPEGWKSRAQLVRLQRALKVLGTFARMEAQGKISYVSWLVALAREVAPEIEAASAPRELTDLLLDLGPRDPSS